jgi:hypothetical protein
MSRRVEIILTKSPQAEQVAETATARSGRGRVPPAEAIRRGWRSPIRLGGWGEERAERTDLDESLR